MVVMCLSKFLLVIILSSLLPLITSVVSAMYQLIVILQVAVPASRAHSTVRHKGQLLGDGRPGPLWALY